jgi:hypothetical protein
MTITLWDEMVERFPTDAIEEAVRVFDVSVREWNRRKLPVAKHNWTFLDWDSETEEISSIAE